MTTAAAIKERPILFSAPMIRAILAGRKTQTRRVVKPSNSTVLGYPASQFWHSLDWSRVRIDPNTGGMGLDIAGNQYLHVGAPNDAEFRVRSKFETGARLWVRETHYRFGHWESVPGVKTKTGRMKWRFVADTTECRFDAPESFRKGRHHKDPATPAWHKRLARFMPRSLVRLTLEVTGVRVERVQDITEADAVAEGALTLGDDAGMGADTAYNRFCGLWMKINGEDSWKANPWVWVVSFKPIGSLEGTEP